MGVATMLAVTRKEHHIAIKDSFLSLTISLHDSLLLLADLDERLGRPTQESYSLLASYYQKQLNSLLQLPPRERQSRLQDLSPEALACLLRVTQGSSTEVLLKKNVSQRRLQQLQEEPVYLQRQRPELATLKATLSDFFQHLDEAVEAGQLQLPDPDEPHY